MAGPDSPRCVNNIFSRNERFETDTIESTEIPASLTNSFCPRKVKATSDGCVSSIFNPNWRAIVNPRSLAPIFLNDRPPAATTSLRPLKRSLRCLDTKMLVLADLCARALRSYRRRPHAHILPTAFRRSVESCRGKTIDPTFSRRIRCDVFERAE